MILVDFRLPPKTLPIEKETSGNYNTHIDSFACQIIDKLQQNGFRIWFKAINRDRFLSNEHLAFF